MERITINSAAKKRLIYAADVGSLRELKEQLGLLGDNAGAIKLGMEIVTHSFLTGEQIFRYVLEETSFRIMLDLKFGDIPATVARAAKEVSLHGKNRILGFTVHCSCGPEALKQAIQAVKDNFGTGKGAPMIIAVTLLTSLNQSDLDILGIQGEPRTVVLHWADMAAHCGAQAIVCSSQETTDVLRIKEDFIVINPGIRFQDSDPGCQKRVTTPKEAILNGASFIVMGSDLRKGNMAENASRAVQEITDGFASYEKPSSIKVSE